MNELDENGYAVIPDILNTEEILSAKTEFHAWKTALPEFKKEHTIHGIFKFHGVGNARHAWQIRTNPKVQAVFKELWKTDELVVSMDGSCYYPPIVSSTKDKCWTHTDQASNKIGRVCVQGFVALTSNIERTLQVYEGSHLLHEQYFKELATTSDKSDNKNTEKDWNLIDVKYLETIKYKKRTLQIPAGSLVLWDSRTFHQNSSISNEERLVQYVCYLPKNNPKNTKAMTKKRAKYFEDMRTTTHWPYSIKVNGLQPQTYGNTEMLIDYSKVVKPDLSDLMQEILKII